MEEKVLFSNMSFLFQSVNRPNVFCSISHGAMFCLPELETSQGNLGSRTWVDVIKLFSFVTDDKAK